MSARSLTTRSGVIRFPAYIPVTTFGEKYPLDKLIQPYLPRLADAVMVSYHYARQMDRRPRLPIMVDSGGFASLFRNARVRRSGSVGVIEIDQGETKETLSPAIVLELQEAIADVAFSLDFPIPPGCNKREATKRYDLTIKNAHWAIENRRRRDLPLYACVQAWDPTSAGECARAYAGVPFDGVAIGGLVPRVKRRALVLSIVEAVRQEIDGKPLHVFGLGHPEMVSKLFRLGVDSVDSSAYVKHAADGKLWAGAPSEISEPSVLERLQLALRHLLACGQKTLPMSTYCKALRSNHSRKV